MKHFSYIIIVFFCCISNSDAQKSNQRIKYYKTWVRYIDGSLKSKGILYELQDSAIIISNSLVVKNYPDGNYELTKINIQEIDKIRTRRTRNIGRGILVGAVSGIVIGGIIGLIDGDDPPDTWFAMTAGEKAAGGGVILGVFGGVAGGLVGTIRVNFKINGNIHTYRSKKKKLQKYSLKYEKF
jgi:hypothetical protein